ncbi:MAG: glycosyltransferase family 2 protein, partial [Sphaerochaetaceae bacterium]|nr:glycosyltransferase family 2 protein [Sphaerochaetaceae bacterium]
MRTNNPFFSVVVPVYNVDKFIRECLSSIQNQTFSDFEVILVDDGSTDESGEICDEYACGDSRFKVIHRANGGPVSARQAAINVATGNYVVPVDSDDMISEVYLETFRRAAENSPSVIICGYTVCSGELRKNVPVELSAGLYCRTDIEKKIFGRLFEDCHGKSIPVTLWAKAFERKLFQKEHTYLGTSIRVGEDMAVVIPCIYRADSLCVINECLYFYNINPQSIMNESKPYDWNQLRMRVNHYRERINLNEYDFYEQFCRSVTHSLFNCASSQFYSHLSYCETKKNIGRHLKEYDEILKKCRFAVFSKGNVAKTVLRLRLYFSMKKYSEHRLRR